MIDDDFFGELFCQDLASLNHRISIGVPNYHKLPGCELHRTWHDNFRKYMITPFSNSTKILSDLYLYRVEVFVKINNEGHSFYREFDGGTMTYDIITCLQEEIAAHAKIDQIDDLSVQLDNRGILKIRIDIL